MLRRAERYGPPGVAPGAEESGADEARAASQTSIQQSLILPSREAIYSSREERSSTMTSGIPVRRGNIYQDLPPTGEDESFETLLTCEAFRLERIVSTGHTSPKDEWFDQTQDEWVVLLQGEAQLLFEGDLDPIDLRPGDWIEIPAHQRHRVERTQKEPRTIWLALHHEPHLGGLKLDTHAQGH